MPRWFDLGNSAGQSLVYPAKSVLDQGLVQTRGVNAPMQRRYIPLANERSKSTPMPNSPVISPVQAISTDGRRLIVVECQSNDPLIALAQARSSSLAGRLAKYHCSARFIVTDTPFTA